MQSSVMYTVGITSMLSGRVSEKVMVALGLGSLPSSLITTSKYRQYTLLILYCLMKALSVESSLRSVRQ